MRAALAVRRSRAAAMASKALQDASLAPPKARCAVYTAGDGKNELAACKTLGNWHRDAFAALAQRIRARRRPEFDRVAPGTLRVSPRGGVRARFDAAAFVTDQTQRTSASGADSRKK